VGTFGQNAGSRNERDGREVTTRTKIALGHLVVWGIMALLIVPVLLLWAGQRIVVLVKHGRL